MTKFSRVLLLLCIWIIGSGAPQAARAQSNFFEGKTIRLIVGFTAGGGYDAYTRTIGRHMGKHISGNPAIIVENMPRQMARPMPWAPPVITATLFCNRIKQSTKADSAICHLERSERDLSGRISK